MSAGRWRLRVCFSKTGRMRFLSHLDFVRAFERATRRAGLPVALSEGFSPAPKIAYGWPLPVGMAGLAEYLDMELTSRVPPETVQAALNDQLPDGFEVREAFYLSPHGPSVMAEMNRGAYTATADAEGFGLEDWRDAARRALAQERLELVRERGGTDGRPVKRKAVDVRPVIDRLEVRSVADGRVKVFMELVLGERGAARPEEVVGFLRMGLPGGRTGAGPDTSGVASVRLGLRREG